MSNVFAFLPKLTLNRRFIGDFLAETAPCFALGMVEERKQQFAALALRPGVTIPPGIMDRGFEFGHSLLGNAAPFVQPAEHPNCLRATAFCSERLRHRGAIR